MKLIKHSGPILIAILLAACNGNNSESKEVKDSANATTEEQSASAKIAVNPLKDCFFGDLHLHTAYSPDAAFFACTLLPEDSYKYAMGEEVEYMGQKVKRIAPLDFLAVTDHAEYFGSVVTVRDPNGPFAGTELYRQYTSTDPKDVQKSFMDFIKEMATNKPNPEINKPEAIKGAWQKSIAAAEMYNKPGKFTTLIGYEWTSAPISAAKTTQNLHRNVIFKGDKVPELPFSSFDSQDPEDLWTYLENARKTGSDVIAIPHNSNISNGLMFDTKTLSGKPVTKEYAERRMINEPLTELIQGKGGSETMPLLSPNDEFANFEPFEILLSGRKVKGKYQSGSFVRQAYGVGQELQAKIGANPFKFGLEAATDFHSGISSSEENNYPGSHGTEDDFSRNYKQLLLDTSALGGNEPPTRISASGITGVWAESNTREAIFEALKRKECFATSGGRIRVRLFAGWNYNSDLLKQNDWVKQAYAGGVPMGADLTPSGSAGKPKFLVQAVKDPNSGNLDRIQIIKVSTINGKSTEKIYDVVWSGDRKKDGKGKLPAVGNTVDVKTATYTNSIGSAELIGYWEDTDFDPNAYVTYYARVLEIPTPRWSTYISARHNMEPGKLVSATIQERAWTSPVWYVPAK